MHGSTVRLTIGGFVRLTHNPDPLPFALTKVLQKTLLVLRTWDVTVHHVCNASRGWSTYGYETDDRSSCR